MAYILLRKGLIMTVEEAKNWILHYENEIAILQDYINKSRENGRDVTWVISGFRQNQ